VQIEEQQEEEEGEKEKENFPSQSPKGGFKQGFTDLEKRYSGLFRAAKFGIAG